MEFRTKEEQVADYLREGIIAGRFPRGARLKQQEIAQMLNTSITPVREALKLLEAEGYVSGGNYRGAVVAPLLDNGLGAWGRADARRAAHRSRVVGSGAGRAGVVSLSIPHYVTSRNLLGAGVRRSGRRAADPPAARRCRGRWPWRRWRG